MQDTDWDEYCDEPSVGDRDTPNTELYPSSDAVVDI